jgi:hypothetical protein
MTLVSTVNVGSGGAASIDFTSIPQTGTDLLILYSIRASNPTVDITLQMTFNSSTTGFTNREMFGTGSSVSTQTGTRYVVAVDGSGATSNTFGNGQVYIPNYAGSTNKSFSIDSVVENNATAGRQNLFAGLWSNTAAITAVTFTGDTFLQHSTASLYTITKGSGGATTSP